MLYDPGLTVNIESNCPLCTESVHAGNKVYTGFKTALQVEYKLISNQQKRLTSYTSAVRLRMLVLSPLVLSLVATNTFDTANFLTQHGCFLLSS